MWYYTNHKINIEEIEEWKNNIDGVFEELIKEEKFNYIFESLNNFWDDVKWYNLERDLKIFSLKYKNLIFIVDWKWEETGDIWKMKINNWKSKTEKAIFTIKEINLEDLK